MKSNEKPIGQKEAYRLGSCPDCHERSHHAYQRHPDDVAQGATSGRSANEGIAKSSREASSKEPQIDLLGLMLGRVLPFCATLKARLQWLACDFLPLSLAKT